ncbi:MAG: hypothetical protein ACK4WJ_06315 [Endomicrobiia bacterium]
MKLKIKKIFFLLTLLIFSSYNTYCFNFLINIFYSMLPKPMRMAFKGEGLQIDQFEYGFGNCNFTSFGYLNSDIEYKVGLNIDKKFSFSVPTFYLYGGYIAHVSTPMLTTIYPGWELETEVGYGGIEYNPELKDKYRRLFISGTSGFNWRIYKSKDVDKYNFILNLAFGYKLHSILKELLYYEVQTAIKIFPKISFSLEYFDTWKGGNFFFFSTETYQSFSKEQNIKLSLNFILSKKYLLKTSYIYKVWQFEEYKIPETKQKNHLSGILISLISR